MKIYIENKFLEVWFKCAVASVFYNKDNAIMDLGDVEFITLSEAVASDDMVYMFVSDVGTMKAVELHYDLSKEDNPFGYIQALLKYEEKLEFKIELLKHALNPHVKESAVILAGIVNYLNITSVECIDEECLYSLFSGYHTNRVAEIPDADVTFLNLVKHKGDVIDMFMTRRDGEMSTQAYVTVMTTVSAVAKE